MVATLSCIFGLSIRSTLYYLLGVLIQDNQIHYGTESDSETSNTKTEMASRRKRQRRQKQEPPPKEDPPTFHQWFSQHLHASHNLLLSMTHNLFPRELQDGMNPDAPRVLKLYVVTHIVPLYDMYDITLQEVAVMTYPVCSLPTAVQITLSLTISNPPILRMSRLNRGQRCLTDGMLITGDESTLQKDGQILAGAQYLTHVTPLMCLLYSLLLSNPRCSPPRLDQIAAVDQALFDDLCPSLTLIIAEYTYSRTLDDVAVELCQAAERLPKCECVRRLLDWGWREGPKKL